MPDAEVPLEAQTEGALPRPETPLPSAPSSAPTRAPDPVLGGDWDALPGFAERREWYETLWSGRGAETFRRYLVRKGAYEAFVIDQLRRRGLPESLKYLPIIESGYNPSAVSWAGAVGLWQLMSGTARDAGLTVSAVLDERRDPVRSTGVALDFLADLRDRFGNWPLALAAYNGGPARVARLARQHATEVEHPDSVYVAIRPHLPRETRDFLPKLLAAASLAGDPAAYGFDDIVASSPLAWDEVVVPDATSVDVLAAAAEADQEVVEALNPQLLRGFTPAGRQTAVRVPPGRGPIFATNYARVPPDERVSFLEHRVVAGDTYWDIAREYGIPIALLEDANPRVSPERLQIGQWLVVPRAPGPGDARRSGSVQTESVVASRGGPPSGGTHVVRRGDTLWDIARLHGVGVRDLRLWNGLTADDLIRPGDRLLVRGCATTVRTC